MLCPVCKTECYDNSICENCGFSELDKEFINQEEAERWLQEVVIPYRENYQLSVDSINDFEIEGTLLSAYKGRAEKVVIPYGIETIDCRFNRWVKKIILPASIKYIGDYAFCRVPLRDFEMPKNVEYIGRGAFVGCLISEIYIHKNVKIIGERAFARGRLQKITVDVANKNYSEEDGVLFSKDKKTLIYFPSGKNNREYIVPQGVKIIGEYAFENSKLEELVIPQSVQYFANKALIFCYSLKRIFCQHLIKPQEWDEKMLTLYTNAKVFWGDEWEYVDGVPTTKQ